MLQIGLQIWVAFNLLIRVPIRVAIKFFKIQSDKLDIADSIAFFASGYCFIGLGIGALVAGEVEETGVAVACIVLFGGILLFMTGAWLYVYITEKREKKK